MTIPHSKADEPMPPDTELVALAQAGNQQAYAQLVNRYYHMVYVVVYGYLKDHDAADDLAQETFIRAYAGLAALRNGKHLPAWLNQVARNHALNWLKHGTRRSRVMTMIPLDTIPPLEGNSAPNPRDEAMAREQQERIERAVLALPEDLRTTVLLHYSADLSKSEIARRLGVHPSSVGRQLKKAYALLKQELGEQRATAPCVDVQPRAQAIARTIALATAFAGLSGTSRASLLQGAGDAALTPAPLSGVSARLHYLASTMGTVAWAGLGTILVMGATALGVTQYNGSRSTGTDIPRLHASAHAPQTTGTSEKRTPSVKPVKVTGDDTARVHVNNPVVVSSVSGTVTYADGPPAENATVRLYQGVAGRVKGDLLQTTSTNARGEYALVMETPPNPTSEWDTYFILEAECAGYRKAHSLIGFKGSSSIGLGGTYTGKDFQLSPLGTITGRVTNDNQEPVAGAQVYVAGFVYPIHALPGPEDMVRTDASGAFSLQADASKDNVVIFMAEGYTPQPMVMKAPLDDAHIVMQDYGATLAGVLVHEVTSSPVAGAEVVLTSHWEDGTTHSALPDRKIVTDAAGQFLLERIPEGPYQLRFDKGNKLFFAPLPAPPSKSVVNGDPIPEIRYLTLRNDKVTSLVLPVYNGHTIKGRVTDKLTQEPIAGVKVYAGSSNSPYSGLSDANGYYRINHVPAIARWSEGQPAPGFYLTSRKDGYGWPRGAGSVGFHFPTIHLMGSNGEVTRNLELVPAITVSGIVRTPEGVPVKGAIVSSTKVPSGGDGPPRSITDDKGAYRMELPMFQTHILRADAQGYTLGVQARKLEDKDVSNVDITLTHPARVTGKVMNENGQPMADVTLNYSITPWNNNSLGLRMSLFGRDCRTNAQGEFSIQDVPPFEFNLTALKKDYRTVSSGLISLKPRETKSNILLSMGKGLSVAGTVRDNKGVPVATVIVADRDSTLSGVTDKDGRFRIEGLAKLPTRLGLTVQTPDWISNEVNITGQPSQNVQVTLDINRNGATLQGQVVDADTSQPLENVRIIGAVDTEVTKTAADGRFEIKHLSIGSSPEYTINADGYLRETLKIEKVESDSTITKTILLGQGKGSIAGRIVQEDGSPAMNLNVQYVRYPSEKDPEALGITKTDSDGHYRFDDVPAGEFSVMATPPSPYIPLSATAKVSIAQKSAELSNMKFSRGSSVVIQFMDEMSGKPLPGVEVNLTGYPGDSRITRKSDSAGRVVIEGAYAQRYSIHIAGYNIWESLRIQEGEPLAERTFTLGRATLTGMVTRNGKPVVGKVVLSKPGPNNVPEIQTDSNGQFSARNLVSGKWALRVDYPTGTGETCEWTTEFEMPPAGLERTFEIENP